MKANVTLKEGRSYTYKSYVFTTTKATPVTDPADIDHLKSINVLVVDVEEPKPVAAAPAKKPVAPVGKTNPAKPGVAAPKPAAAKTEAVEDTDSEEEQEDAEEGDGAPAPSGKAGK